VALTKKQQRFVDEYLIDLNGRQAAIRAGYTVRRAEVTAAELLKNRKVSAYLQEKLAARERRTHITQDRVLQELARLAFFDIRRLYNDDGTMKKPTELDDETAAGLAGIDVVESSETTMEEGELKVTPLFTRKAKGFDKKGALELCMRHLGMLNDKLQVDATVKGSVSYRANIPPRG
jgi:phage terminase small subunit